MWKQIYPQSGRHRTINLKGVFVPSLTPFDPNGDVDESMLRGLVDFLVEAGVAGLAPCGSTGESPYLSRNESKRVVETVIDQVNGRVPVIAGTGAAGTRDTIELTLDAQDVGADAALVITPFFFKLTDEEVYAHYGALLKRVDIPVILYNVPKFTGYTIPPTVVEQLVSEFSGLVGIKDSSNDPGLMAEFIRLAGDRIAVLSGSGDMILPALQMGGKGAIAAIGNAAPRICVSLYKEFSSGNTAEALQYHLKACLLNKILVRDNNQIAALKEAVKLIGRNAGVPRSPMRPLGPKGRESIANVLRYLEII